MFNVSSTYAATKALCFCFVRRGFCPVLSVFLSLCKNTDRISMNFAGGNSYHE